MSRNPPQRRNARARNGVAPKRPGSITAGLVRAAHPFTDAASVMLNLRQCDGSPTGRRRFTGSVYDSAGSRQGSRPQADTTGRKPTGQRYQPVRHRYGHYWQRQRQRQRQRRDYQQNRNIADRLQHIDTHTLTPPGHQALAEIRGAAGAAYFAGRQSLPGFCARADRRLNRLPGKISY
ncbi:TPA: hypothetical protein G8034_004367 [Salmonella enterica]|nr:hypothetical protein [Salmonella enterica]